MTLIEPELRKSVERCTLVVEDDAEFRDFLRLHLTRAPFIGEVLTAAGGEEGLALIESIHPDVVVVDYNMPAMNGAEVARRIKSAHPLTRVIGFSGDIHPGGWADRVIPKGGRESLDALVGEICETPPRAEVAVVFGGTDQVRQALP